MKTSTPFPPLAIAFGLALALPATSGAQAAGFSTISFPSEDGIEITADLYLAGPPEAPFILLFHQADSSRGEYRGIAPRLAALGFNAMAVDQRSGGGTDGVPNQTAARARAAGKSGGYLDALPDMRAAVAYAVAGPARGKLLLWGSSYSASLVLKLAGENPGICDAVLSFSPGEYFYSSTLIRDSVSKLRVPVFVSSGKYETEDWIPIFGAIPEGAKRSFVPKAAGAHGSSALRPERSYAAEYWAAIEPFLAAFR